MRNNFYLTISLRSRVVRENDFLFVLKKKAKKNVIFFNNNKQQEWMNNKNKEEICCTDKFDYVLLCCTVYFLHPAERKEVDRHEETRNIKINKNMTLAL